MPTLWEAVTTNSTLPIESGNTFWDHLNNQQAGGPGSIYGEIEVTLEMADIEVQIEPEYVVVAEDTSYVVELEPEHMVEIE